MANKGIKFSDIKIYEDGTDLKIKAGASELLSVNKTSKKATLNECEIKVINVPMSGGEAIAGAVTLVSFGGDATATVNTTAVQANSIILLTAKEQLTGDQQWVDNVSVGSSFQINSNNSADDGKKVSWLLINPL